MKSILIICNGLKFPYALMEHAFAKAKENAASVHTLFLTAGKETREGYAFPNDLDQAETLTDIEEAKISDLNIIKDHMKLLADMAATDGISSTSELITDCSLKRILDIITGYDLILTDAGYDDPNFSMLGNNKFTLKDLMDQSPSPIQLFSDDEPGN